MARSSLAALDDVAYTYAPAYLAIWSAAAATPPLTPWIRTLSPARRRPAVSTSRHAVWYASGNAAAFVHDSPRGLRYTLTTGTTTRSANVPDICSPRRR